MRFRSLFSILLILLSGAALAHGVEAGDLHIDHPYATPSESGAKTGSVYFRGIHNEGAKADRLISATSPVAASIEIQQAKLEDGAVHMVAVPAMDLPSKLELKMRHDTPNGYRLALMGLKAPLKDGDRFPVVLKFEHAGEHEVMVWVQTPRNGGSTEHKH
jgi:periplasmic copper chaperone A